MLTTIKSNRNSQTSLVGIQTSRATLKVWWCFIKLNVHLPYDPAFSFPGKRPRGTKMYIHPKICPWVFTTAPFINAPNWRQPKRPPTGKWTNNGGTSIQWNPTQQQKVKTIGKYNTDEPQRHCSPQSQKATYYMLPPCIQHAPQGKTSDRERLVVSAG